MGGPLVCKVLCDALQQDHLAVLTFGTGIEVCSVVKDSSGHVMPLTRAGFLVGMSIPTRVSFLLEIILLAG